MTRPVVLFSASFTGFYADPMGIQFLGAVLRRAGYRVMMYDPAGDQLDARGCGEIVAKYRPFLVGVSSLSAEGREQVLQLLTSIRGAGTNCHVCVGGSDSTFHYDDYLRSGLADSVAIGEGELLIVAMAEALLHRRDWREIPGLRFMDGRRVGGSGAPDVVLDLDAIPPPARDTLRRYKQRDSEHNYAYVQGSRGCYGQCTICITPALRQIQETPPMRLRSPRLIADEMTQIATDVGVNYFEFLDDNFLLPGAAGLRRAEELERELMGRGHEVRFQIQARADAVQRRAVERLKNVGLVEIFLGVESFDPDTLSTFRKLCSVEQNEAALHELRRCGFCTELNAQHRVKLGMLIFHAETTLESLERQLQGARRWAISPKRLTESVIPLEGTVLHEQYRKKGYLTYNGRIPSFRFRDERVRVFHQSWMDYIMWIIPIRDRVRLHEKRCFRTGGNADKGLVQGRRRCDMTALDVFEKLLTESQHGASEDRLREIVRRTRQAEERFLQRSV